MMGKPEQLSRRRPMQQNLRRARKAMKKMVQFAEDDAEKQEDKGGRGGGGDRLLQKRGFKAKGRSALPRKRRRKEERKLKKAKKHAFLTGKNLSELTGKKVPSAKPSKAQKTPAKDPKAEDKRKQREEKLKQVKEEARKKQLLEANEEEEKNIRRLEKELKFRKKKKTKEKITPGAFRDDGLDYLLDVVDSAYLQEAGQELGEEFMDLGCVWPQDGARGIDSEDDCEAVSEESDLESADSQRDPRTRKRDASAEHTNKPKRLKGKASDSDPGEGKDVKLISKDQRRTVGQRKSMGRSMDEHQIRLGGRDGVGDESDEDMDSSDEEEDDLEEEDDFDSDVEDEDQDEVETGRDADAGDLEGNPTRSIPKMDPYGNLIGGEKGLAEQTGAYVPPHKRAELMGQAVDEQRRVKMDRLRKQLKGAINRLSESNAQSICNQIEELYLTNSRNDMNETLCSLIQEACVGPAATPERLAMGHILMIAVLHSHVGSEVGAHLLQALATSFDNIHGNSGNYGNGKEIDNIVMLLVHLFNFRVVHCVLVYDIIRRLAERFTERDIEMLLQILKSAGTLLRKDDPSSLKDIILLIQAKASQCPKELKEQSRVKFMLETISALRNNNLRKIPNYDPSHLERLRKLHRGFIKERGHSDMESTLRVSLADLLTADQRGRWWIVGSAWSGHGPTQDPSKSSPSGAPSSANLSMNDETSEKIMQLSRQQRMNTDIRRTIFSIIMTAEDFTDAFEKLVRLGQKGGRDREVVHVTLDCCQQEKDYNPYYAHLASRLCQFDRKFRMAFQFAFWDKIRLLEELTPSCSSNLALLLCHLIVTKALPLSVLKIIEFAEINKHAVRFLRTLLSDLLLEKPDDVIVAVFGGVATVAKLRILREGLGLFMHHFLLKARSWKALKGRGGGGGGGDKEAMIMDKLRIKIQLAESAMQGDDGQVKL